MKPAYILRAEATFPQDPHAEGTSGHWAPFLDKYGALDFEFGRRLPAFGPKRVFTLEPGDIDPGLGFNEDIVLPLGTRRFKVRVWRCPETEYGPGPGRVCFEETDAPETPYSLWDGKAALEARIVTLKRDLQDLRGIGVSADVCFQTMLQEAEAQLAAKIWDGYNPHTTSAFGQPVFIQNPVFPTFQGRAASHLLTFESGWGDCGNENYMVVLDDVGYPVAVFYEASCC